MFICCILLGYDIKQMLLTFNISLGAPFVYVNVLKINLVISLMLVFQNKLEFEIHLNGSCSHHKLEIQKHTCLKDTFRVIDR